MAAQISAKDGNDSARRSTAGCVAGSIHDPADIYDRCLCMRSDGERGS